MTEANPFRITPRLIIGFAILVLGTLWTLDNLNILESEPITRWWPIVLIVIGATTLMNRASNRVGPLILIVIGSLMLASNVGHFDLDIGDLIPLGIALFGAKLVWDALSRRSSSGSEHGDSTVRAFAMMGGVHWHSTSPAFRGGDVNAIMGGVEVDLRDVQIKPGEEAVIDALALMGGIEIFVPADWRIVSHVLPLMGSFENKSGPGNASGPTLIVRGTAVMGAIEVKNSK
jgi:predicted membrane protein